MQYAFSVSLDATFAPDRATLEERIGVVEALERVRPEHQALRGGRKHLGFVFVSRPARAFHQPDRPESYAAAGPSGGLPAR